MFLEILQKLQENTWVRVSFLIKLHTPVQVFSCKFCKISKNTFLHDSFGQLLLYHIPRNYERIFYLWKLQFSVWVQFLRMSQEKLIFRPWSFCESYLHKIIYRLTSKTPNFEELEFVVTRKLRHFQFGYYHVTEANFQVAPGLRMFVIDPNTTSNHQTFGRKMF